MSGIQSKHLVPLLRPLVKLCLKHSLRIMDLVEALKVTLVAVATEELEELGEKPSSSRISVMTGITRREIARIEEQEVFLEDGASLVARVLGEWQGDKHYLDSKGKPRPLSIKRADNEFSELVSYVSNDVSPAAVLFELERLELVKKKGDEVVLLKGENVNTKDEIRSLNLLMRSVETLAQSTTENLYERNQIRNLNTRTEYDNIFEDAIPRLRKWLLREGAKFHERARKEFSKYDKDLSPDDERKGSARIVLTSYGWSSSPCDEKEAQDG